MVATFRPDPKQGAVRLPKYLAAARGQRCVCCGADDGTIVAAHSNLSEHGKGGHHKAHDCMVAWLCMRCHTWYDTDAQRTLVTRLHDWAQHEKGEFIATMICRTIVEAFKQGVLLCG